MRVTNFKTKKYSTVDSKNNNITKDDVGDFIFVLGKVEIAS